MSPIASISGCHYYLVIRDDFSHFCYTFPIGHKSDVANHIVNFCAYAQTQSNLSVRAIQADNGTKFINKSLGSFLASRGVHLCLLCPYTSPSNGKAECDLRTLNNVTCTLLIHSYMTATYWAETLTTATYFLNRRPCSAIQNDIPYRLLHSKPLEYSNMHIFSCLCYPNTSATASHKLAPRSTVCVFLGYPSSHKGYCCLDLSTRKVFIF